MTREDGIGFCPECGRRASWVTLDGVGGCEVHGRVSVNWERSVPAVDVRDLDGNRVKVGQRTVDKNGREIGTVTAITDPDVDWSDRAERAVEVGPKVSVEYDSIEHDEARTVTFEAFATYSRRGNHLGYEVDEIVVKEDS